MFYALLLLISLAAAGLSGVAVRYSLEGGETDKFAPPAAARGGAGVLSGSPGMEGGDVDKNR